jgi:putative nucleotidyltransferase with HDIG domain
MSDDARRIRMAEDLLRHFAASVKAVQLYSLDHPLVMRAVDQLADTLERAHVEAPDVVVGIVDEQVVVDGVPLPGAPGTTDIIDRLRSIDAERIAFDRGVSSEELLTFARCLAAARGSRDSDADDRAPALSSDHIHVGRLNVQRRTDAGRTNVAAMRESYGRAVAGAERLWEHAREEDGPDPAHAIALVEGLAGAIGQNQQAMMALTALRRYDNYTFTHMVNVSVLTMAQAKSLGIDGTLLRQFGLAGLMHDIGKSRIPAEILTKPDRLTEAEFEIMMKHPVDGAEMIRRRLELPPLAAVVAFEHHLRVDQTGYPAGVARSALNLATQLCSIADVYDAMRSKRSYQHAFPTDRIVAVLQQNDRKRFDQRLVRRFSQLMGIYPAGNLVRLDSGELAVVLKIHAPDPSRPVVRVIAAADGQRLKTPRDLALWDEDGHGGPPPRIATPVDPEEAGFDPLPYLDAEPAPRADTA